MALRVSQIAHGTHVIMIYQGDCLTLHVLSSQHLGKLGHLVMEGGCLLLPNRQGDAACVIVGMPEWGEPGHLIVAQGYLGFEERVLQRL
jgi:hypothetical protein